MNPDQLQSLADRRGGVYRLREDPVEIDRVLTSTGWRVGRVDGPPDKHAFLAAIAGALHFPATFGRNFDALWDSLHDVTTPTAVVWTRWDDFAVEQPDDWATLLGILRDRVGEEPPFALVLS